MNEKVQRLRSIAVSVFLGMTALLVSFVAAAAFEGNSFRQVSAECVAAALYLAFCQFWIAPRGGGGFKMKLPTVAAMIAPLAVVIVLMNAVNWTQGFPWLASGCLGTVLGALLAQKVTAMPQPGTPTTDSSVRGRSCHRNLLAGFMLLVAIALLVPIGVIPPILADTHPGLNAGPVGKFFGITVVFDLLAVAILASALWRPRERDPSSKGTLGTTAFLALFLALAYFAFGIGILAGEFGPGLRITSAVLILCAIFGFMTTALMTVTSVIVDRARLCR